MTVYVDQFPGDGWGRWSGGGHLLTTDLAELHACQRRAGWTTDRRQCPGSVR